MAGPRRSRSCYRAFAYLGWTDLIYNHISCRVPGTDDHFLINAYGLAYEEITASSLIKVDLEGNKIGPSIDGYDILRPASSSTPPSMRPAMMQAA